MLDQQQYQHFQTFGFLRLGRRLGNATLDDLTNIRSQLGVMSRGRWYSAKEIRRTLEGFATAYGR